MRLSMFVVTFWVVLTTASFAQHSRVALVVGNSAYDHVPDLPNAVRDAALMARVFEQLGYQTRFVKDANRRELMAALAAFRLDARNASRVVVYFSGHGLREGGSSLMLLRGVDRRGAALADHSVPLNAVLGAVSDKPRQKIIFWDACQTSPLQGEVVNEQRPDQLVAGTFVAFSAQPGGVAFDGSGPVSPFARALAAELVRRPQDITVLMRAVRQRVVKATLGQQIPWSMNSLMSQAILSEPVGSG